MRGGKRRPKCRDRDTSWLKETHPIHGPDFKPVETVSEPDRREGKYQSANPKVFSINMNLLLDRVQARDGGVSSNGPEN